MLEVTELPILAVTAKVPVITHLLAYFFHACFKRSYSGRIFWWQWFVKPLSSFVVISILLLSIFLSSSCSRYDRNVAVFRSTRFAHSG